MLVYKKGTPRHKYIVTGRESPLFVNTIPVHLLNIPKMLNFFFTDNVFVQLCERVFLKHCRHFNGKNCAPLLADLFLNSYEADLLACLLQRLAKSFDYREFMDRYIGSICTARQICSPCHIFPFLFHLPQAWYFMSYSAVVSRKAEDATGASGSCTIQTRKPLYELKNHRSWCYFIPMII